MRRLTPRHSGACAWRPCAPTWTCSATRARTRSRWATLRLPSGSSIPSWSVSMPQANSRRSADCPASKAPSSPTADGSGACMQHSRCAAWRCRRDLGGVARPRGRYRSLLLTVVEHNARARATLCAVRWASTEGEPVCLGCGCLAYYEFHSRQFFKCKACSKQFSGTIFVNAANGISALQLGRDLDVSYKTAFMLAHKLREAMAADQAKYQPNSRWRSIALVSAATSTRRTAKRIEGPPAGRAPDRPAARDGGHARAAEPVIALCGKKRR